jgi:hypothetical protein
VDVEDVCVVRVLDGVAGAELRVAELEALALDPGVDVGAVVNDVEIVLDVPDCDEVTGDVEDDAELAPELSDCDGLAEDVAWVSVGAGDGNPVHSLVTIPYHTCASNLLVHRFNDHSSTLSSSPGMQTPRAQSITSSRHVFKHRQEISAGSHVSRPGSGLLLTLTQFAAHGGTGGSCARTCAVKASRNVSASECIIVVLVVARQE